MNNIITLVFLICILGQVYNQKNNKFLYKKILSDEENYRAEKGYDFQYYTKAAYCNQEDLEKWDCIPCKQHSGMKDIHVIENKQYQSQQYVAYNPESNLIVIAFRGSSNIRNWLSNLHFTKTSYHYCNGCKVHAGFNNIYEATSEEIMEAYQTLISKYQNAQLLIAGHSLGGAIATLTALEFRRNLINVDYIYTYGCPRVGNKRFAEYGGNLLPNLNQVIHHKDMVPHVPAMAQGFRRLPTEVWYPEEKDYNIQDYKWCPSEPGEENKDCSDQYSVFHSIDDHLSYYNMYTGCDLDAYDQNNPIYYNNMNNDNIKENIQNEIFYFEDVYQQDEYIQ